MMQELMDLTCLADSNRCGRPFGRSTPCRAAAEIRLKARAETPGRTPKRTDPASGRTVEGAGELRRERAAMTRQSAFVGEDEEPRGSRVVAAAPQRDVAVPGPAAGAKAQQGAAPARPVAEMSFEEALAELEAIVQKLERGQLDLESSIAAYERGTELRRHCAAKLKEAELRVEKLSFDKNGNARLTPLDNA